VIIWFECDGSVDYWGGCSVALLGFYYNGVVVVDKGAVFVTSVL